VVIRLRPDSSNVGWSSGRCPGVDRVPRGSETVNIEARQDPAIGPRPHIIVHSDHERRPAQGSLGRPKQDQPGLDLVTRFLPVPDVDRLCATVHQPLIKQPKTHSAVVGSHEAERAGLPVRKLEIDDGRFPSLGRNCAPLRWACPRNRVLISTAARRHPRRSADDLAKVG
jgi:hypothetical protein